MKLNARKSDILGLTLALVSFCSGGCADEPGPTTEGESSSTSGTSGTTDAGPKGAYCPYCNGGTVYACECIDAQGEHAPAGGLHWEDKCNGFDYSEDCEIACFNQYGWENSAIIEIACAYEPPDAPTTGEEPTTGSIAVDCDYWDPSSEVTLYDGIYYVLGGILSDVVDDPLQLVYCDDAIVREIPASVGFEVDNANSGELLYELGLRDGDIPLEINGMPLDTHQDALDAFLELYVLGGSGGQYELYLLRGTSPLTLNYDVVYTK